MQTIKTLALSLLFFCFIACGNIKPKLVQVSGKIIFKGKPLTAGNIYFHPAPTNTFKNDNPSSILQEDGTFNMKTFPYGEGVSPGDYKITLAPQLASRISLPYLSNLDKTNAIITVPETGIENFILDVGTLKTK